MTDAGEHAARGDAAELSAGYERLRCAVLSGSPGGWRLGHGVLSAHGMTGWMRAFGAFAPAAATSSVLGPSSATGVGAPPTDAWSLPGADQVVAVLAQMVLPLAA